jgi:hypothetical protein
MGMLGQARILMAEVEEGYVSVLYRLDSDLDELQYIGLSQRRRAPVGAFRDQRAKSASRPNDLSRCLLLWLRAVGAMERGVWTLADFAAEHVSHQYLGDTMLCRSQLWDDSGLQSSCKFLLRKTCYSTDYC